MNDSQKYYAKQNKSNIEENILQGAVYMKLQKRPNNSKVIKKINSQLGQEWVGLTGKGHKENFCSDENVLKHNFGGYTVNTWSKRIELKLYLNWMHFIICKLPQ